VNDREIEKLLSEEPSGRIGYARGEFIDVVPIGFVAIEGDIWFHSKSGTKTQALIKNPRCSFEIDWFDISNGDWKSVIAWGVAIPNGGTPAQRATATKAIALKYGHLMNRVRSGADRGQLWQIKGSHRTGRTGP